MANLSMEMVLFVKTIEVKPGDIVVLEPRERLTEHRYAHIKKSFSEAQQRGQIPKDVGFLLLDDADKFDFRRMPEDEQRALLDKLCASLGMRAIPLG